MVWHSYNNNQRYDTNTTDTINRQLSSSPQHGGDGGNYNYNTTLQINTTDKTTNITKVLASKVVSLS